MKCNSFMYEAHKSGAILSAKVGHRYLVGKWIKTNFRCIIVLTKDESMKKHVKKQIVTETDFSPKAK